MAARHPLSAVVLLSVGATLLAACEKDTRVLPAPSAISAVPPPPSPAPAPPPQAAPTGTPARAEVALAPQRPSACGASRRAAELLHPPSLDVDHVDAAILAEGGSSRGDLPQT